VSQLCDLSVTEPAYGASRMIKTVRNVLVGVALAGALAGCSKRKEAATEGAGGGAASASGGGSVKLDGSSTVFPISQAVSEEFQKSGGGQVTVASSGTGGGFKKLCRGETDIAGASRPIKPSEVEECQKAGIDWVELPIAYDGIAVVVNPKNTFVDKLTVAELKKMWEPDAAQKITSWSQIREGWPDKKLRLFGAGVDSGTYDYFTLAAVGKERSSRGDFTSSEDDNVLVQGVAMDQDALAFFGFAYYGHNKDKLKIVPIDDEKPDNGAGPIEPTLETVANGTYQPLSRPIFIYVSKKALEREIVSKYVTYYLANARKLAAEEGYIPLPEKAYELVEKRFAARTSGSVFGGEGSKVGVTIEQLLANEGG
jgi:phosphate transport system substrate-binding protein